MTRGETGKQRQTRIELQILQATRRDRPLAGEIDLDRGRAGRPVAWSAPIWDRRTTAPLRLFEWDRLASPGPLARVHSTVGIELRDMSCSFSADERVASDTVRLAEHSR